ncbi:RHS repeat domain-containing protein [Flavobacterium daejeonense]|uniref:RHS repeat domain-containing protein n=1 Tax=Flavobacterium daejeonense TaxID=350893 RepID=UPI001FE1BBF9|nr:RHS repeat-associated core domain-containing protein [Flavobacterium daejeonense]
MLKSDGTAQNYLYLQRDYQGSIVAVSDATGVVVEKRLFDAWGNVLVQDGVGNTLAGLTILDRGYTGHEHLQSVGLIHMNGRLYDAKLHRFLQPDNYVQDPGNTQNYNRYGYVLNNPLKYIDPSGELSWKSIGRWFKRNANDIIAGVQIVGGVILTVTGLPEFGVPLIGAGVAHFGAAYAEYTKTGDWSSASKNAGVFFNVSFSTDWGYNSDKKNGVNQNEPVVTPKSDIDDKEKDNGNSGNDYVIGPGNSYLGDVVHNYGGVKGLTVSNFYGYHTGDRGGVVIELSYTGVKAKGGNWAQKIYTDSPLNNKTSPYWDGDTGSMYYYTNSELKRMTNGNTISFYDNPHRYSDANWRGVLTLYNGNKRVFSLSYGFTIKKGATTVYPIKIIYP